jgi:hypothetical protein
MLDAKNLSADSECTALTRADDRALLDLPVTSEVPQTR